jgi:hypothetical protein
MAKAQKKSVRIDPPQRPIDGAIPYFNVKDKDPDREYVWVYKAAGSDFNVEHYEYLGWEIETYRAGGPRPAMMLAGKAEKLNGQVIESRGNVLMSIAKERHQEIVETGDDGVSGQKSADVFERRLLDPNKHIKDAMRGINPRLRDAGFGVEFDKGAAMADLPSSGVE